jgi:hypothetical protein
MLRLQMVRPTFRTGFSESLMIEEDAKYPHRLVSDSSAPNHGHDSRLWSYHPYVSMYHDQDAGSYGPVIVYNRGKMESVMAQNREFIVLYADNQEWNSFLALQNARKYLPAVASQVVNQSDQYPVINRGRGNSSIWYPQLINSPKTNVTPQMAPNFFPVSASLFSGFRSNYVPQIPARRIATKEHVSS